MSLWQATASPGQKLGHPKAADGKGAFALVETLLVAVEQTWAGAQPLLDSLRRLLQPRRRGVVEAVQRHEQDGGVHCIPAQCLRVALKPRIEALLLDFAADQLAIGLALLSGKSRQLATLVDLEQPVECCPAQEP